MPHITARILYCFQSQSYFAKFVMAIIFLTEEKMNVFLTQAKNSLCHESERVDL
jgi:hypothetical protein